MIDTARIAAALRDGGVGGWLLHDFRGSNPVFARMLGAELFLTRRAFLLFAPDQPPRLLVSRVDATEALAARLPGVTVERYVRWTELRDWLRKRVAPLGPVAMEYSPEGALPALSFVDAGTLELVRAAGAAVVSSADVVQLTAATWSEASLASHHAAMAHAVAAKDLAFAHVARRLHAGEPCTEHGIQSLILAELARRGMVTDEPPVVAVNAHSGDPHYVPSAERSAEIHAGDWLLIDLWCRERREDAVFADITWVGQLGTTIPDDRRDAFEVVARARDAVVEAVRAARPDADPVRGYELDRVARAVIERAGYGDAFVHRTGHSLSPGAVVHGLGANLDDFETHDTRPLRPGLGFTVEPGVYLEGFGVRSEINVYMDAAGPVVTAPVQTSPLAPGW